MTQIVLPTTSRANTDANLFSDVYSDVSAIATVVNGDLRNDNIAAAGTANIAPGKLSAGSSGQLLLCNSSGVPTYQSVTGDVTTTAGGVTSIGTNKVVTANINDSAVTTAKINAGAVTNPKLGLSASLDTLTSTTTLTNAYQTLCTVSVTSGKTYLIFGSVGLRPPVNLTSATFLNLNYNGADHETEEIDIAAGGATTIPLNTTVTISSGSAINLKAKDTSAHVCDAVGANLASGLVTTRLVVIQIA